MKPRILITPSYDYAPGKPRSDFRYGLNSTYTKAIAAAGALPLVCLDENAAELLEEADGVLFSGGVDWDPKYFGETVLNSTVELSPERDVPELELFCRVLERGLPILGICRGIQTISVALGGSLWQDIPAQLPDALAHSGTRHEVFTQEGSLIRRLCGERFVTNSFHHQAVRDPGRGMRATAHAPDGVIEATEHETLPIWGYQWHPEYMTGRVRAEGLEEMGEIFRDFVRRCAEENSR